MRGELKMKKTLFVVVTLCTCITLLITAGNALAFGKNKFKSVEFRINGTAKTMIISTKDYLGKAPLEGYLVELNGAIISEVMIGTDFATSEIFGVSTPFFCEIQAVEYTWDRSTDELVATDAIGTCYDKIGRTDPWPDPFINVEGCEMVLKFSDSSNFSGKFKCLDEATDSKFIGKFEGAAMGTYNPDVFGPPEE
jgi:hypothetical protein